jgi:hypothetical protein
MTLRRHLLDLLSETPRSVSSILNVSWHRSSTMEPRVPRLTIIRTPRA